MKKRILSICLALLMSISFISNINMHEPVQAAGSAVLQSTGDNEVDFDTPNDGIYGVLKYDVKDDGTIIITDCTDDNIEEITIPKYIDEKPVTEIASYSFMELFSLKKVVLPNTLKVIGGCVFEDCTSLTDITIPESVEIIRGDAFYGCTSLESLTIPASVLEVGNSCFDRCTSLTELVFLNADCIIGYSGDYRKLEQLAIGGYSGSTAEAFANYYGITFVPIDLPLMAGVGYCTHIQTYGWEDIWSVDGEVSGTSGEGKRLEAIAIQLYDQPLSGNIEYITHVQSYGWENTWRKNGEISGTSGQAKRLEAIKIRLTGEMAQKYDIYYRVHSQTFGWQGWAKNGQPTGTAGFAKRLEAIQIMIVYKGFLESQDDIDMDGYLSYIDGTKPSWAIQYGTHVQGIGWRPYAMNGEIEGTVGEGKRLEAIIIDLCAFPEIGGVEYRTHVQTYGWEKTWRKDEEVSGTTGEAKRLEAIQIRLTGEIAKQYDVYYRVHAQSYGWLGWAKNGQSAGTEGLAKRLEAIQIVVVKKGQPAPGSTATPFIKK